MLSRSSYARQAHRAENLRPLAEPSAATAPSEARRESSRIMASLRGSVWPGLRTTSMGMRKSPAQK